MEKNAMEEAFRASVHILYWQAGADHHECIQLACPTFPYFALTASPPYVQILLGVYGDADKLIETFDPAHGKWITHEAWMPRDLSACRYMLCRDRYPWGLAEDVPDDMEGEVNVLLERVKETRKRVRSPQSTDARASPGPSKRQKRVTATASTSGTLLIQN